MKSRNRVRRRFIVCALLPLVAFCLAPYPSLGADFSQTHPVASSRYPGTEAAIKADFSHNLHELHSSDDPNDNDFDDLMPIKNALTGVSIVGLGEGLHGDAAAYRTKVRLVRFLHEKLGFNVLVWEAGVLEAQAVDGALRDNAKVSVEEASRMLMDGAWATSPAVRPLFQYARQTWKTAQPLRFAGMDGGQSAQGIVLLERFLSDLHERVPAAEPSREEISNILALAIRTYKAHASERTSISSEARRQQLRALTNLAKRLNSNWRLVVGTYGPRGAEFVRHVLVALQADEAVEYAYARYLTTHAHLLVERSLRLREKEMRSNLLWLSQTYFPGEKIIVWAATAHLRRAAAQGGSAGAPELRRMTAGGYIASAVKQRYYVIAITAGTGTTGEGDDCDHSRPRPLISSGHGSFEWWAHELGFRTSFVDLRRAGRETWFSGDFVTNAIGYSPVRGHWQEFVDALIYLPKAEPDLVPCSH